MDAFPLSSLTPFSGQGSNQGWKRFLLGRKPNKDRMFAEPLKWFNHIYLDEEHIYDEKDFETRFRMPRRLFVYLSHDLYGRGVFQ